jgi:hypothetical protein
MLISMPQGTSTILGAFQAISALHFRDFGRIRPGLNYCGRKSSPVKFSRAEPYCAATKARGTVLSGGTALRLAHSVANPVLIKQL